jgi:hypothetical protein
MTKLSTLAAVMLFAACTVQSEPQPAGPPPPPAGEEVGEPVEGEPPPEGAEAGAEAAAGGEMPGFECHSNDSRAIDGATINGDLNVHAAASPSTAARSAARSTCTATPP